MEEKKFSMIVLAFIFMVAIPSIIFLFSNNAGNTGNSVLDSRVQYAYDGMVSPNYNAYDTSDRGRLVPIYDDKGVAYYVTAKPTVTAQRLYYNPSNSYSALKSGDCPAHCVAIKSANSAEARAATGSNVVKVGDSYCLC